MYKEAKDTEDKLIPAYRESGQIGKMQLKLMADQVLSGWYDLKTSKGQAIYKLNTHFMKANIPKADLIEKAIEGLEHVLKHEAPKVENANFEKKQLKNTIHNLQLLLEEVNGLDDNDEDGDTKKAYYRSKEAVFGLSKEEKFMAGIKKKLNSAIKASGLQAKYSPNRLKLTSSKNKSSLDAFINFKGNTWEISYNLAFPHKENDYTEKFNGKISPDLDTAEVFRHIDRFISQYYLTIKDNKKAGVQDFVDNFNSKFIRSNLMKSFQSVYDADFRELGVNLKYKAIIKNGQDLGFEAEFKGRTDSFKSVSIYLAANRSRKECFLDYTLIRNKPLSEGGVEKREKRFTRTLESSDFSNSNKGFGAAIDYLLDQLDDPDQSVSFKV